MPTATATSAFPMAASYAPGHWTPSPPPAELSFPASRDQRRGKGTQVERPGLIIRLGVRTLSLRTPSQRLRRCWPGITAATWLGQRVYLLIRKVAGNNRH